MTSSNPYNLACVFAFLSTGSSFVAFMTSPLTFNLPPMNSFWAFALPATRSPKSLSLSTSVVVAFLGGAPLPTVPVSLRSIHHDSVSLALFLSSKPKMVPTFLMASARSEGDDAREALMASKATEEGKASVNGVVG